MEYIPVEVTPDPVEPVNKVPGKTKARRTKKAEPGTAPGSPGAAATRAAAAPVRPGVAVTAAEVVPAPEEVQAAYVRYRQQEQGPRAPVEFSPSKWLVILVLGLVLGLAAMCLIFIGVMLLCHVLAPQTAVWVVLAVVGSAGAVSLAFFVKATGGKPFYATRMLLSFLVHPDRKNVTWG